MENENKNYGESSAFVRRLDKGLPLRDGRYSDSLSFVRKLNKGEAMKPRTDLDENYVE